MPNSAIKLNENHFCLTSCKDIRNICAPLKKLFPFHHLWYSRTYNDGSSAALTTNIKVMQNLDKTFITGADGNGHYLKNGYLLQPDIEDTFIPGETLRHYRDAFEIDNQLILIKENEKYTELYSFVAQPETKGIYSYYTNYLNLFDQFTIYFQEKAKKLIQQSEKNKIVVPKHEKDINFLRASEFEHDKYKNEIRPLRYEIKIEGNTCYLTRREFDVVSSLARGSSMKQAGRKLDLSPRTVEHYLANVKSKFKHHSRGQVVEAFLMSSLMKIK